LELRAGEEIEPREEPEREEEDGLGRLNVDGRETDGEVREAWDAGALIRADGRELEEDEDFTELPRSFPEDWDRCGSRTVEVRDAPGSCPRGRETRPSFPRFPESPLRSGETTAPRRYSVTPFPPRSPEFRPLG
jgi:hypothetical protein